MRPIPQTLIVWSLTAASFTFAFCTFDNQLAKLFASWLSTSEFSL